MTYTVYSERPIIVLAGQFYTNYARISATDLAANEVRLQDNAYKPLYIIY